MRLHRSALFVAVAPLVFALTLASCGGGGEPTEPTPSNNDSGGNPPGGNNPPGGGGGPPTAASVTVSDNQFSPGTVILAKNGTVTWTFGGAYATPHNVTFPDGDSSNDKTEGTFTKTFPNTGVFTYRCTNHSGMNGTVDVK